ncbi:SET and MYND domain-containing protein 4 isoform X1 [Lepisosteus oculatus]|uniref:SET and MYND domain-containing protein 4 isoform X1 n=1 Tax=Lepisosteus oculatus TaxID=7918 RepID=UPI00371D5E74
MDLPCPEWQRHVEQKWKLLPSVQKQAFTSLTEPAEMYAFCVTLVNGEDAALLSRAARGRSVRKSPDCARLLREQGNGKFKARDYLGALLRYSKGVCQADPGSQELALCLANRSAALFHLAQYQECLRDIRRALSQGYPGHLEPKLLARRAECLSQLERAREEEEEGSASAEIRTAGEGVMERQAPQAQSGRLTGTLLCASPAVALRFGHGKGRHLLAAADIAPGEVVVQEEAFSCVLIPEEAVRPAVERGAAGTEDWHCHRCLRRALSPVPCQGCSYARYCGEECREQAWEGCHRWECPLGGELLAAGVLAHLALRVALQAGCEEIKRVQDQGRGDEETLDRMSTREKSDQPDVDGSTNSTPVPGCDPSGRYLGSSYLCVHHLLPHTHRHAPSLRFLCAATVATLCLRLKGAGPLSEKGGGASPSDRSGSQSQSETEDERQGRPLELGMLGAAALRHMLQLRCNAQAITAVRDTGVGDSAVQSSAEVRIATAIFPTLSLLNHSCSPNTSVSFQSNLVTVRTAQAVLAGQELLHCYGPHRSRMAVIERQRLLQEQYFFQCQCAACCQELESECRGHGREALGVCCMRCHSAVQRCEEGYVCSQASCGFVLPRADLSHRLQAVQGLVAGAVSLLETGQPEEAVQQLQEAVSLASPFLSPSHPLQGEAADALARAYATLGRWNQAAAQLRRSVEAVRSHHGEDSVELGHQLFKLAQLHFKGADIGAALAVIPEARRLLVRHCGPGCEEVEELQGLEDLLRGALRF